MARCILALLASIFKMLSPSCIFDELNFTVILYTVIAIVVTVLLKYFFTKCQRDPGLVKLSKTLPGPPSWPLIGNSWELCQTEDTLKLMVNYLEKYGHVYRLWIGKYLTIGLSKVEDIETIFMSSKMLGKPGFFQAYQDFWGDGLFTASSVPDWRKHRKLFQPLFNRNALNSYVPQFNEKIYKFVDKMTDFVNGPEFDIGPYLTNLSFDIVVKTTLNVDLEWDDELSQQFHSSIIKAAEIGFVKACFPWLHHKFFENLFFMNHMKKLREIAKKYLQKVIEEKKDEVERQIEFYKNEDLDSRENIGIPPKSFLTLAYGLQQDEGNEEIMYDEILNILTGKKLHDELIEVLGDSDRVADENDITRLIYLDQVIKETLRRFSINAVISREVEEDSKIGDRIIPAGTSVIISVPGVHFNPEYYPDPWKFNPDNFSFEAVQKRHKLTYLAFSSGPRNCIANRFAMLEMKMTLVALLRKFSFHTTMKMEDIRIRNNGFALISIDGYKVTIKSRCV